MTLEELQERLRDKTAERDAADEEIASLERQIVEARRDQDARHAFKTMNEPGRFIRSLADHV